MKPGAFRGRSMGPLRADKLQGEQKGWRGCWHETPGTCTAADTFTHCLPSLRFRATEEGGYVEPLNVHCNRSKFWEADKATSRPPSETQGSQQAPCSPSPGRGRLLPVSTEVPPPSVRPRLLTLTTHAQAAAALRGFFFWELCYFQETCSFWKRVALEVTCLIV